MDIYHRYLQDNYPTRTLEVFHLWGQQQYFFLDDYFAMSMQSANVSILSCDMYALFKDPKC